jgi:hypothetical protein
MAEINIPQQACDNPRWRAAVQYRFDAGSRCVTHDLEEIFELHDLIDKGPYWDTVQKIEILRVNHIDGENLTFEESMRL